jgi:hypothetical protein
MKSICDELYIHAEASWHLELSQNFATQSAEHYAAGSKYYQGTYTNLCKVQCDTERKGYGPKIRLTHKD